MNKALERPQSNSEKIVYRSPEAKAEGTKKWQKTRILKLLYTGNSLVETENSPDCKEGHYEKHSFVSLSVFNQVKRLSI